MVFRSRNDDSAGGGGAVRASRVALAVVAVLAIVFICENTRQVRVRVLIPEVTMPLWLAMAVVAVIGAACGGYLSRRRL